MFWCKYRNSKTIYLYTQSLRQETSSVLHLDGFVRSPAGAPHYHHSTAASRKLVEQTSNGNATTSPTEGTKSNVVSNRSQSTYYSILFSFAVVSCFISFLYPFLIFSYLHALRLMTFLSLTPTLTSPWTRFSSVVAQPL